MNYVGIDPGVSGAFVRLDECGAIVGWCSQFADYLEIFRLVAGFLVRPCKVAVEFVHSSPVFGAKGNWAFSAAVHALYCGLDNAGVSYELVKVNVWQKETTLKSDGSDPKARAKAAASRLWPGHDILRHGGAIDAALIAEWLRRREIGGK